MKRILGAVWRPIGRQAVVALFLLAGATPCLAADAKEPPAGDASNGELRIEGKLIESLMVVNKAGNSRAINRPGASVSLPADQYSIQQIKLEGGFTCFYPAADQSFSVTPDKPCRLQAGAPLTPEVTFTRSGKILTLDYRLLDAAGRDYRPSGGSLAPPRFVVYQGEREIGSGSFEYG
ncbi:MAG: hypothetical protein HQ582_07460 [Planctomycetes bacterium]|nr:hypothetical protein [Planctomycetota bacterium]